MPKFLISTLYPIRYPFPLLPIGRTIPLFIFFCILGCRIGIIRFRSPILVQKGGGGGNIQKRKKTQNQVLSNLVPVSHTYPGTSTVRDAWRCLAGKEKAPVLYSYLQTSQGAANMITERDEWLEIRAHNTVRYCTRRRIADCITTRKFCSAPAL